ncbi:mechanosensitive ion channel domain-containing protein [Vibrio sp. E150_011]|uniref:mechanosensitive ion channel domain-containing protein n=1 Tax=unclassified Vibrio TaxID=2614977 RepID=UPI000C851B4C|nr:mechanosensitive ion channel domain-containing protein [Vibrio sp. 10N.286.48.B7]PMH79346.1 mechanosensitive ion channel protein MscS [Vibrio sp. 10N.286.48.B7]
MEHISQLISQLPHALAVKALLALGLLTLYYLVGKVATRWINKLAQAKQVSVARTSFILRTFRIAITFIFVAVFSVTIGIGYGDLSLFFSSVFAVLGVALVAQWSMLSNITASFLIFFVFPYRIGERIKVVDKDEDISGVIQDITMFHVLIRHDSGNLITYPNTLMLQKSVIKLSPTKKPSTQARLYTRRKN